MSPVGSPTEPITVINRPSATTTNWTLGERFHQRYPQLDGVKALWETKWKLPCSLSVYPFPDGKIQDFAPIFERLIEGNVNDAYLDTYTQSFLSTAERLTDAAMSAQGSDRAKVAELFKHGHRPDNTGRTDEFLSRGWGCVITEIPGTADCPAARRDPKSPDRLFTSILDWMDQQPYFNMRKCIAWGLLACGYYAIRVAHYHKSRLAESVGQGAGSHLFLSREWLEHVDDHEYPFVLSEAYVSKYGYKDWEDLLKNAQKDFSLVESGLLNGPCS